MPSTPFAFCSIYLCDAMGRAGLGLFSSGCELLCVLDAQCPSPCACIGCVKVSPWCVSAEGI